MTESDFSLPRMSVHVQLDGLNRLPIHDELRRAIEEALQHDEKARHGITGLGVIEFIRRYEGEIRMAKLPNGNTEPQIRKYEEEDLSTLVKMVNENYLDYPDFFYEFIPYKEETLRSKVVARPFVFVAKNQTIEGSIECSADWGTRIDMLCVKPGPNRTKIEDMLISRVEEEVKANRITV